MNKKLVIGICAGAAALILIVFAIVAVSSGLFSITPKSSESSGSSGSSSLTDSAGSSGSSSTGGSSSSGSKTSSEPVVEKGGIIIGSVSGKPGDTVTVPVKLSKNPGIMAMLLDFKYDSSVLTYSSYKNGDLLSDIEVNATEGSVRMIDIENNDFKTDGTIINLVFKINKNAKPGKYDITLDVGPGSISNYDEQSIVPKVTNGTVTVK